MIALSGRTVIVCRKAVDLFTDYLEDALPVRDRARLEAHLAGRPHCFEYLRQMRTTIDAHHAAALGDLCELGAASGRQPVQTETPPRAFASSSPARVPQFNAQHGL